MGLTVLLLDSTALERVAEVIDGDIKRALGGADAEHDLRNGADAVVFDVALVDDDFLFRVRRDAPAAAAFAWLAARRTERTAALLDGGAADVVDASMSDAELRARLNRARVGSATTRAFVGELSIDLDRGTATWRGETLRLTRRERELLHALASENGQTIRRELLYRKVWGYAMARGDRTVDVNVKRVRDKLAAAGVGCTIATEPGVGYRLETAVTAS